MAVVKRKPLPRISDAAREIHRQELMKRQQEEQGCNETQEIYNHDSKELSIDNNQEAKNSYDLERFQPALSKTTTRSNLTEGVISVVNSKGSKKVILSKDLMNKLSNPNKVAISFSEEHIAIGVRLPNNNNQLNIKISGKKGVIYSSGIVAEISDKYKLDFSDRTSITFSEVEYIEHNGLTVAIINVK